MSVRSNTYGKYVSVCSNTYGKYDIKKTIFAGCFFVFFKYKNLRALDVFLKAKSVYIFLTSQ